MQLENVKIKRVIGPTPSGAAVLLGNEKKTFVVFVGFYEAAAILREINHETPARPLTHELIQNILIGFDVEVKSIVVHQILENTFCATLVLQQKVQPGKEEWVGKRHEVRIDARPSDCFVLALKNKADIHVTKEVFDQVQDVSKMAEEVEGTLAGGQMGAATTAEFDLDLPSGGEAPEEGTGSGEPFGDLSDLELRDEDDEEEEEEP